MAVIRLSISKRGNVLSTVLYSETISNFFKEKFFPFSVQVHHSFVDGIHVGKFVNMLQNYLNTLQL